ncbi:NADP-dependent oxidoreductase [Roseomonas sp. NAR14]|uniref:NADP-dependent oxidoreductase n=1 Tax=Roseomonas acroporae TaxID=2937791 RepID=A0A9X1Y7R3_9PROT|nr:NADP-dependent oxidoreductase [Roseomonas acroporae]MCK8784718.1 NADP-dependent oxidoreductase [Roseomonas acroporae]
MSGTTTSDDRTTRRIVLAARPQGKPKASDFRLETAPLPPPGPGQVVLRALYLSLDPYMRGRMDDRKSYAPPVPLDGVMEGECVAEVVESNDPSRPVGTIVLARMGWQTHAVMDGKGLRRIDPAEAPVSTALGVLGMPGFTAYSGMRVIGQPKPGETVVVAAASGPVGSLVGQLARLAGARAVGIAGGPEKCAHVRGELGFDAAIDHRAADFPAQLAAACPKGIDVYFENVAGPVLEAVIPLLNRYARIPVCGLIAQYSGGGTPPAGPDRLPGLMRDVLTKSLTIRGFINYDFFGIPGIQEDFRREVGGGVRSGAIRYREDIVDGLENAPAAFMGMLEGRNFGKMLVRIGT